MATMPRKPVTRSVRIAWPPNGAVPGLIEIHVGKEQADYFVREIGHPTGRAFEVEKYCGHEGQAYRVVLEQEGHSCDCKGFAFTGHCRHEGAVRKLVELGKL